MRKQWVILAASTLLLVMLVMSMGIGPVAGQGSATLRLETVALADVGAAGVVNAMFECPGGCSAFTVEVSYDPAVVWVNAATVGPFLGEGVLAGENLVDNNSGRVRLAAQTINTPPTGTEPVLFRLDVVGVAEGLSPVDITLIEVLDLTGQPVAVNTEPGLVTVGDVEGVLDSPLDPDLELAFVSERDGNREIYAMNATGGVARRLTENPASDEYPTWSPSGSKLAFVSDRDGNAEIYSMNPDGSNVQRLTDNPALDQFPTWSQDETQIAFASNRDGNSEIYVMNADGSNVRRLTDNPALDTMPVWSPDGRQIAFVTDRDGARDVYVMNADGTNVQRVTDTFGSGGWYPDWSPDTQQFVFTVAHDGQGVIYRVGSDGIGTTQLGGEPDRIGRASWSSDGLWIAYVSTQDGNAELYVMDTDGGQVIRMTDVAADDIQPDWRPLSLAACSIQAATTDTPVRVGPGFNRSIFSYLAEGQEFLVTGQFTANDGSAWWRIDKTALTSDSTINSLWVNQADVTQVGGCAGVALVEPPPVIVNIPQSTPDGGWGQCGSCTTCGGPASECQTNPDGECVWNPEVCGSVPLTTPPPNSTPPPDGEVNCYYLNYRANPIRAATMIRVPEPNCPPRLHQENTLVTVSYTNPAGTFGGWTTTCPVIVSQNFSQIVVRMTANCEVVANFQPAG